MLVHGMVNMRWTGMANAWAQWICAKLTGFAMMAWATKGSWVWGSGSMHDFQQPSSISTIMARLRWISPSRRVFIPGIRPGFLTIYFLTLEKMQARQAMKNVRPSIGLDHPQSDRIRGLPDAQNYQKRDGWPTGLDSHAVEARCPRRRMAGHRHGYRRLGSLY